ncbi:iron-sulfur cluster biosynthesis family protein [Amphibacillus sp. MSJ-3]|uniref:iron-sulfur cluster biosynthesis family protein n=1 Tax=Amphibacillus sp. MSJ-3 TaxID=2841505 RepID=UPI001C0EFB4C|nr:iron-sulfur cluster biosynthesis family protein [Amphibacillus sp. MSJ-3]MBU5594282.1 iron-sulfur cluster biosynthesis family protein [Amphibacillus sp. MSJ-3]
MKLLMDHKTVAKLKTFQPVDKPYLLLKFDSSGTACTVTGTPTIEFTDQIDPDYHSVDQTDFDVYINKFDYMFFEQVIELEDIGNGFKMTSPSGLLNPIIPNNQLNKNLP